MHPPAVSQEVAQPAGRVACPAASQPRADSSTGSGWAPWVTWGSCCGSPSRRSRLAARDTASVLASENCPASSMTSRSREPAGTSLPVMVHAVPPTRQPPGAGQQPGDIAVGRQLSTGPGAGAESFLATTAGPRRPCRWPGTAGSPPRCATGPPRRPSSLPPPAGRSRGRQRRFCRCRAGPGRPGRNGPGPAATQRWRVRSRQRHRRRAEPRPGRAACGTAAAVCEGCPGPVGRAVEGTADPTAFGQVPPGGLDADRRQRLVLGEGHREMRVRSHLGGLAFGDGDEGVGRVIRCGLQVADPRPEVERPGHRRCIRRRHALRRRGVIEPAPGGIRTEVGTFGHSAA